MALTGSFSLGTGTAGEPINPEAWRWFHDVVGEGRCAVVDTFWQTERWVQACPSCPPAVRSSQLRKSCVHAVFLFLRCFVSRSGGVLLTPLPGATPTKPGSATNPFLGIDAALLDAGGNVGAPGPRLSIPSMEHRSFFSNTETSLHELQQWTRRT